MNTEHVVYKYIEWYWDHWWTVALGSAVIVYCILTYKMKRRK